MTYLDKIVDRKKIELLQRPRRKILSSCLKGNSFSIIAEVKRKSPSKGDLAIINSPEMLASSYVDGGAVAVSVLTDADFNGTLSDLQSVAHSNPNVPIIRKDFILDPIQIAEAATAGASTVLLIVKILGNKTKDFIDLAETMGLEALVEVHDEKELNTAIHAGAKIIGVNNRDLKSFQVNLEVSERLAPLIPEGILKVSESGVSTNDDIQRLKASGYDAALIGEALVKACNPASKLKELLSCQ